jgi:hypothetical protein
MRARAAQGARVSVASANVLASGATIATASGGSIQSRSIIGSIAACSMSLDIWEVSRPEASIKINSPARKRRSDKRASLKCRNPSGVARPESLTVTS